MLSGYEMHADAKATIVARLDLPRESAVPRGAVLPFGLAVAHLDPAMRREVRVRVDRGGSGRNRATMFRTAAVQCQPRDGRMSPTCPSFQGEQHKACSMVGIAVMFI